MMKAAVLEELGKLVVREVPTPVCDDDSALVRVRACAVCGSDLRIYRSGNNRVKLPQILGHEISGEVVKVGKNVEKIKVGDRVAIGADVPCGQCSFCEDGIGNNCQTNYAMGYQYPGGFAEYVLLNKMVMEQGPVHRIPDDGSFDEYALAEPLGCIVNAMEEMHISLGDTVVIIGCGPIGCMMIPVVKKLGAAKVICVERAAERQTIALKSGADVIVNPSECDIVEAVLKETGGLGADVILTATPVPEMQERAIRMAKNRARINFFGGLPAEKSNVTLNTNLIHYKELFVHGSHGSLPRQHRKAVELIRMGTIDVKPFITHSFSLDEIQKAFDMAASRACMRVVVHP